MIIPLGHEQRSVRRQPWVTWIIMALCLVVFLFTGPGDKERARESLERRITLSSTPTSNRRRVSGSVLS